MNGHSHKEASCFECAVPFCSVCFQTGCPTCNEYKFPAGEMLVVARREYPLSNTYPIPSEAPPLDLAERFAFCQTAFRRIFPALVQDLLTRYEATIRQMETRHA